MNTALPKKDIPADYMFYFLQKCGNDSATI